MSKLKQAVRDKREQQKAAPPGATAMTTIDFLSGPKVRAQIQEALGRAANSERFFRVLMTEIKQTPQLMTATTGSMLSAVLDLAQLGLEVGPLGQAYLVPFNNKERGVLEATLILGYKGIIHLTRQSGSLLDIRARTVFERDQFEVEYGTSERIVHKPYMGPEEPGLGTHYYMVANFKDGGQFSLAMSRAQVEPFRARSRAKSGPWVTDYDAMAMKTTIRRAAPWLPLTVKVAEAIQADEARDLGYAAAGAGIIEGHAYEVSDEKPKEGAAADPPPATAAPSSGQEAPQGGKAKEAAPGQDRSDARSGLPPTPDPDDEPPHPAQGVLVS